MHIPEIRVGITDLYENSWKGWNSCKQLEICIRKQLSQKLMNVYKIITMSTSSKNFRLTSWYSLFKYLSVVFFLISTGLLFVYLNRVQPYYFIDEVFHIPQTLRYCAGNFTEWDPKITTLPGLYFITASILSPFNLCSIVYIRSINLFGTFANFYLTRNIIKEIHKSNRTNSRSEWMQLALAYNITLFPPLYFWCFLYYTDVVSVNMVLLMLLLHLRKYFKMAAFAGLLSIFIRQTNIVWVVFLAMERALDLLECKTEKPVHPRLLTTPFHLRLLWKNLMYEIHGGPTSFIKFIIYMLSNLYPYVLVGFLFLAFLIWNEGIVVGDRAAHTPTIHIPQIFYFSAFMFFFLWPYMIPYLGKFLRSLQEHWILTSCCFACMIAVIHYNTLVHPYVLADNRHYVFYVWNRIMNRHYICKYLLIPLYCFTMYTMLRNIGHLRFVSRIIYVSCVGIVLIPQLLLEPRYFIIPYIFYRLSLQKPMRWQIILESLMTLIVNILQFSIFVNKVFYWEDQAYPQRISW